MTMKGQVKQEKNCLIWRSERGGRHKWKHHSRLYLFPVERQILEDLSRISIAVANSAECALHPHCYALQVALWSSVDVRVPVNTASSKSDRDLRNQFGRKYSSLPRWVNSASCTPDWANNMQRISKLSVSKVYLCGVTLFRVGLRGYARTWSSPSRFCCLLTPDSVICIGKPEDTRGNIRKYILYKIWSSFTSCAFAQK